MGCCDARYLINWKGWLWLACVLFFAGILQILGITLYYYRWTMSCSDGAGSETENYFMAMPDWGYCCNKNELSADDTEGVQCISWYSDAWEDYVEAFNPDRVGGIHPDVEGFAKCAGGYQKFKAFDNLFFIGIFDKDYIPDADTAQTMVDFLSVLCVSLAMSFFTGIFMLLAAFAPWDGFRNFIKHFGSAMLIAGGTFELIGVLMPTWFYYNFIRSVAPSMEGVLPDNCGNAYGENGLAIALAAISAAAVFATASYIRFPPTKVCGIVVSETIRNKDGSVRREYAEKRQKERGSKRVRGKKKKDDFSGSNPMHDKL